MIESPSFANGATGRFERLAWRASRLRYILAPGLSPLANISHCGPERVQHNRPRSSQRHSTVFFSPFFGLCGHCALASTHLHRPVPLNLHMQLLEGRPGRLMVQRILSRQLWLPQCFVRCPRMQAMQASLRVSPLAVSVTSGGPPSMVSGERSSRFVVCSAKVNLK